MSLPSHEQLAAEHELQRDAFDQQAKSYNTDFVGSRANRNHYAKIRRVAEAIHVKPGDRVLEIGTGTGLHAQWLIEQTGCKYTGTDISPAMLEQARGTLGDEVELVVTAAESLPFDEGRFDAVYCSGTLHHVADKAQGVREMARVVKPGGHVVLSEPNRWNPLNIKAYLTERVERGVIEMNVGNFGKWYRQAGLEVVRREFFNFTPPVPKSWSGGYDRIDKLCGSIPVLRRISSMILFVGRKPADDSQVEP